MKQDFFSVHTWTMRFVYAANGLRSFFRTEHNAIVYTLASSWIIALSFLAGVSRMEAILLIIVTGLVWICELFNTTIEKLADVVCPEKDYRVKIVKDVAAAAVLMAAITALLTGLIIFIPKFL